MTLFETDYRYNLSLYRPPKEGKPEVERTLITESRVRVIKEKLRQNLTIIRERI